MRANKPTPCGNNPIQPDSNIGDPEVIPRYPAITIDAKSRNSEWFTAFVTDVDLLSFRYKIGQKNDNLCEIVKSIAKHAFNSIKKNYG